MGLAMLTAACGDTQGQRATTGALGGVAFGAAVGGPIGAIVGGAAGAGAGAERGTIDQTVNTGAQKAEAAVGMDRPENTANTASAAAGPSTGTPAMASAGRRLSSQDVRDAQTRLKNLGLYNGNVDGIYGRKTTAAINDFQVQNGLRGTGTLTNATRQKLEAAAGTRNDQPQTAQQPAPNDQTGNSPTGAAPAGQNQDTGRQDTNSTSSAPGNPPQPAH
jgi:peptidoglycan hydrolase-like protein with peptidoglycan-binding domain